MTEQPDESSQPTATASESQVCGIVMPISMCDGCPPAHWIDVKGIITEAVARAGFSANLVSTAVEVGVIHKRIVQNLYENPIVVADVSGQNPNVMFELGMRLAFDKPTIIIKDDKTSYSFDTAGIEHLEYPRDLRYQRIIGFKLDLARKVSDTLRRSRDDPSYTTFLKHFGTFHAVQIETKPASKDDRIIDELGELRELVTRLMARTIRSDISTPTQTLSGLDWRALDPHLRQDLSMWKSQILAERSPITNDQLKNELLRRLRGDTRGKYIYSDNDVKQMVNEFVDSYP